MAEETNETIAPATEATNTTEAAPQEEATPTALETLVTEVSEKLEAQKAERNLDYIDDGDDLEVQPVAAGVEETVESLKARLAESEQARQRAENRSSARKLQEEMKEEFPNVNPDTLSKYVRLVASGRKSSDSVRAIFDASNRDFARGEEASDKRWKNRFEELQKTSQATAEQEVQDAWGTPATSTPLSGKDKISLDEFNEAIKQPGLTEAQMFELEKRLNI